MSPTTSTIVAVPESRVDSSIYKGPLQACRVFCQRLGLNAITFRRRTEQIAASLVCARSQRKTVKVLPTVVERNVSAQIVSEVDLARTGNFLLRIKQHLF